jgi:hypothetical protein
MEPARAKINSHSFANDAAERYALFNEKATRPESKDDTLIRQHLFSMSQSRKEKVLQRFGNSRVTED